MEAETPRVQYDDREHQVDYGQRLLPKLIDEIARSDPERQFAIVPRTADPEDGYDEIDFSRFGKAVDGCSWWLEGQLGKDAAHQTIAYYGSLDLMYHIVTLAAVKTGHTYFPEPNSITDEDQAYLPSHRNSSAVHTHLLQEISCDISLVQVSIPPGLSRLSARTSMRTIIVPDLDFFLQSKDVSNYPYDKTFDEARYSPFVVLHTSGSTGMPHPIIVNHGTLASFDAYQLIPSLTGKPVLGSSLPGTRMLMAFPYFHMASFTLLLGLAVYYGVIIVLPPPHQPLTASLVDAIHMNVDVDGCALPPSILVDIYHDKAMLSRLEHLKFIFFAGGPLPPEVGNAVARATHLSTLFGSTEIGFPIQEVCSPEDWEYVRYSPFYGSLFRPLGEDDLFEQILVRRRELDLFQSVFSTYPKIAEFSTKDLYRKHPVKSGLWKFMGRTDDVIVLSNAEKLNPVDFESVVSSHPAIRSALVGGHGKPQTCLLVEPAVVSERDTGHMELLNTIWPTILEANRTCPTHARIMKDFVIFVDEERGVERAGKGTIQREPTLQLYRNDIDRLYEAPALPNTLPEMLVQVKDQESKPLRKALLDIISTCLELDGELAPTANLFDHGLDSIQTVALAKKINAYFMQSNRRPPTVNPQAIYTNPSVEKLESQLQDDTSPNGHDSQETEMQAIFEEWSRSLPRSRSIPVQTLPEKSVILLTGSTGSLGSYILNTLLSLPNIEKIYCLTRGDNGHSRQIKSFQFKSLEHQFDTVTFLPCDFAKPTLGLEGSIYRTLQQQVTHVIHNAWDVNLYRRLDTFISPHISGVRYLIDLCAASMYNAHLLFVSTQSTSLGLPQMRNKAIPEAPSSTWGSAQHMGYAQSKLIAEQLLAAAASISGIRAVVCRVGQIAGPTDGEKGSASYLALTATSDMPSHYPTVFNSPPSNPTTSIPTTSIPTTSIPTASSLTTTCKTFNVVNPHSTNYPHLIPAIQSSSPLPLQLIPFSSWLQTLRDSAEPNKKTEESLPALKLLPFLESFLRTEDGPKGTLSTSEAERYSETMRGLESVGDSWVREWMRGWMSLEMMDRGKGGDWGIRGGEVCAA
ncbi:MAG: hypothetical protein LQ343_006176 [Gyalolechia ehrenbergii]|nr:MAG: hypothetical protein LQ343_006176 [Gyalolechia ehrenbergii]